MMNKDIQEAKVERIKRWSAIWIIPVITVLIGISILFYYYTNRGETFVLVANNADGIVAGRTKIKTHNVDVGVVENVSLSDNFEQAIIKARVYKGMEQLLNNSTVFWIVNPKIGLEGISGLNTLFSGAYIQLQSGMQKNRHKFNGPFRLLTTRPVSSPNDPGIYLRLESPRKVQLSEGDAIRFRGFKVGSIEKIDFDIKNREFIYQLFINAPYNQLVTENTRFWQEGGINMDISSSGINVSLPSLDLLLNSGVSFDVPDGAEQGTPAKDGQTYFLYKDKASIGDSLYTHQDNFVLLFDGSVRGLAVGAPVEYRGIRIGSVKEVPYKEYYREVKKHNFFEGAIPILISIEPKRINYVDENNLIQHLKDDSKKRLRASLQTANLLTGSLLVNLDVYSDVPDWKGPWEINNLSIIPTTSGGIQQIQDKLIGVLDKIQKLPVEPMVGEMNDTLKTVKALASSVNKLVSHKDIQNLPGEIGSLVRELDKALKNIQPGTPLHTTILGDLQRLEQVLREMQPLLRTLNDKSNALIINAGVASDPIPVKSATAGDKE